MTYTTTKCRNCGYRTRNRETGPVPTLQIGPSVLLCPQCGHLILDNFSTEYEFMNDKEKTKFSTQKILRKSYKENILLIIFGLMFLIGGIVSSVVISEIAPIIYGIIAGAIFIIGAILKIRRDQELAKEGVIERAIYESLYRTSNIQYVEFLSKAYAANRSKRKYAPYLEKETFMEQHKENELSATYKEKECMFHKVMEAINADMPVESSKVSIFTHY